MSHEFQTNVYDHPGPSNGSVIFPGCSNCGGWFSLSRGEFVTRCCAEPTSPTFEALQNFAQERA